MKTRRSTGALVRLVRRAAILVGGSLVGWGCAGSVDVLGTSDAATAGDGAGGDIAGESAASTTGATSAGTGGDSPVVPPECTSPSGYKVCGGSNHCPYSDDFCAPGCSPSEEFGGFLSMCYDDVFYDYMKAVGKGHHSCAYCIDGDVCFNPYPPPHYDFIPCVPFEYAQLIAANGAPEQVRYGDHGLWTGAPLPESVDCPTLPDVPLCGSACGGCAEGETCVGRAPLHPYGLCISPETIEFHHCNTDRPCEAGKGCFHWKVEPEAQAQSDARGICIPLATCKAAAATIPGGGYCVEP